MPSTPCSVLFVCLGNICRSPLAEGVLLHHLEEAGLGDSVEVDSAGTGAWHLGERPDSRSIEVANRHGIELPGFARRVVPEDFENFDYIYAMDGSNLRDLQRLREGTGGRAVVELFRANDPEAGPDADVPDPYYGGDGGFDRVFEMVDRTCRVIVERLSPPAPGEQSA
jgi:low molecular weight protein-tyrosine phosphatase